jgi:hypothetical protein
MKLPIWTVSNDLHVTVRNGFAIHEDVCGYAGRIKMYTPIHTWVRGSAYHDPLPLVQFKLSAVGIQNALPVVTSCQSQGRSSDAHSSITRPLLRLPGIFGTGQ